MLRRLYHALALMCIVVTLSVGMFLLATVVMGRVTAENTAALGRMLRGEPVAPPVAVQDAPATRPAPRQDVAEQVVRNQEMTEMDNLALQRGLEELRHQRLQLEALSRQIAQERAALREERLAWARQIEAARQDKSGEAFARQLKLFEALPTKQVKDIMMGMTEEQAANYLSAMKRSVAADVMTRFRQPQEQQFLQRVLEQMRESS